MSSYKQQVHIMSPEERAAHSVYISHEDFDSLSEIAARLAATYRPDSYERFWHGRHIHLFGATIVLGMLLAASPAPWWCAPLPFLLVTALTVRVPWLLWRRRAHSPRWAHPLAELSNDEAANVAAIVARFKPVQRTLVEAQLPATTGDKFFEIWHLAQRMRAGHGC